MPIHTSYPPLSLGDHGDAVVELHRRLSDLGFDADKRSSEFNATTTDAITAFQVSRGLEADGLCTGAVWRAILEAEHRLGDRLLFLTTPMLRGEDVAELQLRLGSLGFDSGRIDGIFGPETERSLHEFQRNVDIVVDDVCGPESIAHLLRLTARGTGLSVAGLRERESLRGQHPRLEGLRIALCHDLGFEYVSGTVGADLQRADAEVTLLSDSDWSAMAQLVNEFEATLCIALLVTERTECEVAYFGTTGFESAAGKALAELLLKEFPHTPHWPLPAARSMRVPILRETRCPTIQLKIGRSEHVFDHLSLISAAIQRTVVAWAGLRA
jgi:N-acetylmuramoyl-L-alanine amidase